MKEEIYKIKCSTFRRTLELHVGWDPEELFWNVWFDWNLTAGFYWFDPENNCNIIWMRDYNLSTLVHELVHCVEWITEQVWLDMKWEPIAFIYEELFTNIWIQCWKKFKLDEKTKNYFTK